MSLPLPNGWRGPPYPCAPRAFSLFENFLFPPLFDDAGTWRRNVAQAVAGVEDVAAIAERSDGVGHESPRVDDIAVGAHRVRADGVGDPVAPQPLGGAVIIGGHHRVGVGAVQEGAG